jgi:iron-sulfur cluster assembly protein
MLGMTEDAINAIKELAPGAAGLRIFTSALRDAADGQALQVQVVEEPSPDDQVLDAGGARVFLDPRAATLLDDKVLDATFDGTSVRFALAGDG